MDQTIVETQQQPVSEPVAKKTIKGVVDFTLVSKSLKKANLETVGERQQLSGGFAGPLFTINTKEGVRVVEKAFIRGGRQAETGKRYRIIQKALDMARSPVRQRLGLVNNITGEVDEGVVDWVYNEEMALRELADIPGVPKLYGAVYKKAMGSVLIQYIDGYDLSEIVEREGDRQNIVHVYKKLREVYRQAAKRGYFYNNPGGSTVMVDAKTKQPYLIDWYNHSIDLFKSETGRQKYLAGIKEIEKAKQIWLEEFDRRKVEGVRDKLQALVVG